MITIPTHALLDMIGDMLPFVDTDKDSIATHCVRVEQADDVLTMLATNRAIAARVTWSPDGDGGRTKGDDFSVRITPTDAKAIVSTFKLPSKLDHAPVQVSAYQVTSLADNLYRVKIFRPAEPDMWSELSMHVTGRGAPRPDSGDVPEMDIHKLIDVHMGDKPEAMLAGIKLSPRVLAALGRVERHGALQFIFRKSRDGAPFYVKGDNAALGLFDAVVMPVKGKPDAYERAVGQVSDVLRDGAGVLAS